MEKECKKTEKCCENHLGSNVSNFVTRLKITLLFVSGQFHYCQLTDSTNNDHSQRITNLPLTDTQPPTT